MSLFRDLFKNLSFGNIFKPCNTSAELQAVLLDLMPLEIPQAYIQSNSPVAVANARFKGRADLFCEIRALEVADETSPLLICGQPYIGKTAFLRSLPYRVGPFLVPLLVDVRKLVSALTLSEFAENLALQIIEAARQLPRPLELPSFDRTKLVLDPFPTLLDWFRELEAVFPDRRFLLCLDDFHCLDQLAETIPPSVPLNFLRHVLQHRPAWGFIFTTSSDPKCRPDYWTWSSYLISSRTLRLGYLDEQSARDLILRPLDFFLDIYEPAAVDAIIHLTGCHPFFLQLTCYELVEYLNRPIAVENRRHDRTLKATVQDVEAVIPAVLERAGSYFSKLMQTLLPRHHSVMTRLAQGQAPTVQDKIVLSQLERADILKRTGVRYSFQVPLLQKYIQWVTEGSVVEDD